MLYLIFNLYEIKTVVECMRIGILQSKNYFIIIMIMYHLTYITVKRDSKIEVIAFTVLLFSRFCIQQIFSFHRVVEMISITLHHYFKHHYSLYKC